MTSLSNDILAKNFAFAKTKFYRMRKIQLPEQEFFDQLPIPTSLEDSERWSYFDLFSQKHIPFTQSKEWLNTLGYKEVKHLYGKLNHS
jgi:hypothetical protein